MTRLDELRTALPEFGFALYAIEPGGPVTLEVIDPTGTILTYRDATADAVLALAFPPDDAPDDAPADDFDVMD